MNTKNIQPGRYWRCSATVLGVTTTAFLLALSGTPSAKADASTIDEVSYVMALDKDGIRYSSEDAAIAAGYAICDHLGHGASLWQVIHTGVKGSGGYYTMNQVAYITGAAIAAFCPELDPTKVGA